MSLSGARSVASSTLLSYYVSGPPVTLLAGGRITGCSAVIPAATPMGSFLGFPSIVVVCLLYCNRVSKLAFGCDCCYYMG